MGMPIPKRIQNAPELLLGLELYYVAFQDLTLSRPAGLGLTRIPWAAVHDYCERLDIHGEQREDMFYHIFAMDDAWLEHQNKKSGSDA